MSDIEKAGGPVPGWKIGYARVSTLGQSFDLQLEALRAAGCEDGNIYMEKVSGKSSGNRIELQKALKACRRGDTLVVTKLDRLARSVGDLHKIVEQLNTKEASLQVIHQPEIDTSSKYGKLIFTVLGAVAELERDLILERTREGREKYKADGKPFGPKKKLGGEKLDAALAELAAGHESAAVIAAKYNISRPTLYRLKAEREGKK